MESIAGGRGGVPRGRETCPPPRARPSVCPHAEATPWTASALIHARRHRLAALASWDRGAQARDRLPSVPSPTAQGASPALHGTGDEPGPDQPPFYKSHRRRLTEGVLRVLGGS